MHTLARSIDEFPPLEQSAILDQIKDLLADTLCQNLFNGIQVNAETLRNLNAKPITNSNVRNVINNRK